MFGDRTRPVLRNETSYWMAATNIRQYGHHAAIFKEELKSGGVRYLMLLGDKIVAEERNRELATALGNALGSIGGYHKSGTIKVFEGTSSEMWVDAPTVSLSFEEDDDFFVETVVHQAKKALYEIFWR